MCFFLELNRKFISKIYISGPLLLLGLVYVGSTRRVLGSYVGSCIALYTAWSKSSNVRFVYRFTFVYEGIGAYVVQADKPLRNIQYYICVNSDQLCMRLN